MAITATDIQKRRLTILTIIRSIGALLLIPAAMSLFAFLFSAVSGSLAYEAAYWIYVALAACLAAPLFASFVFHHWICRVLVPAPRGGSCGACGFELGTEPPRTCPECGLSTHDASPAVVPQTGEQMQVQLIMWRAKARLTLITGLRFVGVGVLLLTLFQALSLVGYMVQGSWYYDDDYFAAWNIGLVFRGAQTALLLALGVALLIANRRITQRLLPRPTDMPGDERA